MKRILFSLTILLAIGFLLRTFGLEQTPPALNSDELLKVFDGASVYRTGRDHHGETFPLFFRQSGEYSPPFYIYFAGLFSAPFGINAYTTRLPAAVLGTLSLLLVYLLLRELSGPRAGIIAAALVTVSPWHIFYSRIGWEAISLLPFQLAGLWLFFVWRHRGRRWALLLSAFCFAFTIYTYPAARLFIPLLLLGLLGLHHRFVLEHWRQVLLALGVMLLTALPYLWALSRNYEAMQARWNFVSVLHNDNGWSLFLQHYVQHLSPLFLFISGDRNPLHAMAGGVALLVLLPFLILGLFDLLHHRDADRGIFIGWLLIFAIPSSLTYDRYDPWSMPNALRSTCGIPVLEIISTYGIVWLLDRLKSPLGKKTASVGIALAVGINAAVILYDYFVRYPVYAAPACQYGLREAVQFLEERKSQYERMIVSPQVRLHPVSLAVFSGLPPQPFSAPDFSEYMIPFFNYAPVYSDFGIREFQRYGNIARWYNLAEGKHLFLTTPGEISTGTPLAQFHNPDGSESYLIYATDRR